MNRKTPAILTTAALITAQHASGATLKIDTFDTSSVELSSMTIASNTSRNFDSDLFKSAFSFRDIELSGRGVWSVTSDLNSGTITYNSEVVNNFEKFHLFELFYTAGTTVPIDPNRYSAILLDIKNISGQASLDVRYLSSGLPEGSTSLVLDRSGQVLIPFSDLHDDPITGIKGLGLDIRPSTTDPFSITLNGIFVVPEPSSLLLAFTGLGFAFRRRRSR